MDARIPVEVNHIKQKGVVRITWDDGHVGDYPREYLRGYCPCAQCQGHGGGALKFVGGADSDLREIEGVGNYALQFTWGDGHSTGIYTFAYLRALCPCSVCEGERGMQEPLKE